MNRRELIRSGLLAAGAASTANLWSQAPGTPSYDDLANALQLGAMLGQVEGFLQVGVDLLNSGASTGLQASEYKYVLDTALFSAQNYAAQLSPANLPNQNNQFATWRTAMSASNRSTNLPALLQMIQNGRNAMAAQFSAPPGGVSRLSCIMNMGVRLGNSEAFCRDSAAHPGIMAWIFEFDD